MPASTKQHGTSNFSNVFSLKNIRRQRKS